MTLLSLAARNTLAQDTRVTSLVASSASWDTWIFDTNPVGVRFEQTGKALVVINEVGTWTDMNEHNRLEFPLLQVDIWADPDRKPDGTVLRDNAKDKVLTIARAINWTLHTVGGHPSGWYVWGTATQIQERTGVYVVDSKRRSGPDFQPIKDAEKAWMGRYTFAVKTA